MNLIAFRLDDNGDPVRALPRENVPKAAGRTVQSVIDRMVRDWKAAPAGGGAKQAKLDEWQIKGWQVFGILIVPIFPPADETKRILPATYVAEKLDPAWSPAEIATHLGNIGFPEQPYRQVVLGRLAVGWQVEDIPNESGNITLADVDAICDALDDRKRAEFARMAVALGIREDAENLAAQIAAAPAGNPLIVAARARGWLP